MERWESDEDSDQSEEERDRDVDAAEGLQLSEMAVVRLRLCIRIHWIHCVSGPCKNTQNTYLTSRVRFGGYRKFESQRVRTQRRALISTGWGLSNPASFAACPLFCGVYH